MNEGTNRRHVEGNIQAQPDNSGSGDSNNPPKALESNDDMSVSDVTQDETQPESDKFFIERIIGHKINRSKKHKNARPGELLYKVHWNGYSTEESTWEPIQNLTKSHIIAYHNSKKLELPARLGETIDDTVEDEPTESGEGEPRENSIIDKLVGHDRDMARNTWSYKVRWYGKGHRYDTWEPLPELPRSKILEYHKRQRLNLPDNLDLSIDG